MKASEMAKVRSPASAPAERAGLALGLPSPGVYLRAWKHALAGGVVCFRRFEEHGVERFTRALHARINARGDLPVRMAPWRKLDDGWYWWAWRLSRTVNGTRIIVRPPDVPRELRGRLAGRITWPDDE